jgi:hypothetical protein
LEQSGEFHNQIQTLGMTRMAELAADLALHIEADRLRDELLVLSGDLKKYGYDFTNLSWVARHWRHLYLLISR